MTKYGVVSDLHLEFRDDNFSKELARYYNEADCDTLILAGDIHSDPEKRDRFFMRLEKPYIFVMGNHDYYGGEYFEFDYQDENIYGCTLWTNFDNSPSCEFFAKKEIADFSYIQDFTTDKCREQFTVDRFKIFESKKPIIVTHFSPSWQSIGAKHSGSTLNPYFHNNLDYQIIDSEIKIWIHGHTHEKADYILGDCRVICNPSGYPNENKLVNGKYPWDLVFFEY